jgi:tetratricopeptide (TPR) repeat protein
MNMDYCFMKRVQGVLIFAFLLVTACSSVRESPRAAVAVTDAPETVAAVDATGEREFQPTDPNVMYHVFAAEVLGTEGDFSGAASEYLEAAMLSEDPEIAERAARVAVSAAEWQMVALASDRWATLAPESLEARELAAGSRLREGDYVGAEYQLARILEMTAPDQGVGWQIVISLLAPANDRARASKVLDHLLTDFSSHTNADALYALSQFEAQKGELQNAVDFVDQAIELEPERADFQAWSGRLAVNMGNSDLALQRYQHAWELNRDDLQIATSYAELLKRNDELAAGLAVLAQLPDTPDMRFARIVFALDAGDRESAEQLYRGFSENRYEGNPDAAFQAAQSAELLEYKREAIDWYEQVTGEQSQWAIMRRAFLHAGLGDLETGRNLLGQLRLQADDGFRSQSYQAEAQMLQDAGRRDEAMKILNQALADLPNDISIRYMRALSAVGLGQLELAESDLRTIITAQPDNAAAINALGYTLADLTDRYDEAEQLINLAYDLQPSDAAIIDSMGWISYRRGRLQEAENYLREAWQLMPNAEVAAHLGEVLWVSGKEDEARSLWELGLQMESGNEILVKTMQSFGVLP